MPYNRDTLHESRFSGFKDYLSEKGWTIEKPKGTYEVIRASKKGSKPVILYQNHTSNHATIGWDMPHALKLVYRYIKHYKQIEKLKEQL